MVTGVQTCALPIFQSGLLYSMLAAMEKLADLEAKFGQRLVIRRSELLHGADLDAVEPFRSYSIS